MLPSGCNPEKYLCTEINSWHFVSNAVELNSLTQLKFYPW